MNLKRRSLLALQASVVAWCFASALAEEKPGEQRGRHLLTAHREPVKRIIYSRDGKYLASSAGWDTKGFAHGEVKLWDPITGDLRKVILDVEAEGASASFSADGKTIVTAWRKTPDGIQFWDTETGKLLKSLSAPIKEAEVLRAFFSPDGKVLAINTRHHGSYLLDPSSGKQLLAIAPPLGIGSFSPDGSFIEWGNTLLNREGKVVRELDIQGLPDFSSMTYSPDSKTLAMGHKTGEVSLWNLETGKRIAMFKGSQQLSIKCVRISPDGKWLIAGSNDGAVSIWSLKTRKECHCFSPSGSSAIYAVAFRPDSKVFLTGDGSGCIIAFDPATGRRLDFPLPPMK
jgi:WD40 repeat protein